MMNAVYRRAVLGMALLLFAGMVSAAPNTQLITPLPQHAGEIVVPGLQNDVEIIRDAWGIPHIYASNTYDLFFAQGFTQAQDRWWQMEWSRHTGSGRVSELIGKTGLGTDVFVRTVGARQVVETEFATIYSEEIRGYLQAFADGVNAYILNRDPGELAVQYSSLKLAGMDIQVEPWTPADTLIWGKVMAYSLGGNESIEQLLSALTAQLSQGMIDAYAPPWPYEHRPTIVMPEDLPITDASLYAYFNDTAGIKGIQTQLAGSVSPGLDMGFGSQTAGLGSNNWVVSGSMTKSGLPMLANDPHLSIQMPSIWYEIGLHCQPVSATCPFDVVGFTFSPTAGVIIGHNSHIAWGMTNVGPDVQDLYQIRVNPDNPLQYEWNGEWRDMTTREETIYFGDETPPVTIQVRETHLGPIINDNQINNGEIQGFNNENPLALRWTALEPGTQFEAFLRLNLAENWQAFREALRYFDAPSQNFIYADIDGNIGYQTPGKLPIRAEGHSGLLPVPGWIDDYEWRGYIPFDQLPRILNPERGYIATANQAVVPLAYYDQLAEELGSGQNYAIGYFFAYGYRAKRIVELIQSLRPHTADTFAAIQGDNKNLSAEEILPYLAPVQFDDPNAAEARNWLLTWDFQMHMDSPQAALYAQFWARLVTNLYNDQLAGVRRASGNDNELWATYLLMQEPDHAWWDDVNTPDMIETRDDLLRRSFAEAYAMTIEALGGNRETWRWGDLHTATFVSDPLGRSGIPLAETLVNRGPVAASGGSSIVNATSWNARSFRVDSLPSMRMIVDLGDFTGSMAMHTTGQVGNPFSSHYDDMIEPWRHIEYHPMLWTREQLEVSRVKTLLLKPGG